MPGGNRTVQSLLRARPAHAAALAAILLLTPLARGQQPQTGHVPVNPGMHSARSAVASPPVVFGQAANPVVIGGPLAVESRKARAAGQEVLPSFPAAPSTDADGADHRPDTSPENQLLQLMLQERALLEDFGDDHPQVQSLRGRIAVARVHVAEHRAREAERDKIRAAAAAPRPEPIIIRPAEVPPPPPVVVVVPPAPLSLESLKIELQQPVSEFATRQVTASEPAAVMPTPALPAPEPLPNPEALPAPVAPGFPVLPWSAGLAAVVLGLVLHVVVLVCILRRPDKQLPSPLRVELLNAPAMALAPQPAPAVVQPRQRSRVAAEEAGASSQEEAILRQVLEQNLQLRDEITELAGAAA